MSKTTKHRCFFLVASALLINMFLPLQVRADGGAPNLAYVAGAEQGVGIIDVAQRRVATKFTIPGHPYSILLSPDGRLLYVTQPASGRVSILAAKTGQTLCNAPFTGHPSLLALSVDASTLYITGTNETTILAVDAQTCALQHTFHTPEPVSWLAATGITTSAAFQTQLWVAETSAVTVLDEQGQTLATIPIASGPQFLSLPGSLTAYVATRQGSVMAIDMQSHQVFATLLAGGKFGSMDYNAVTGEIYVPDQQRDQVDVLSPVLLGSALTAREPEQVIHVNGSPQSIAITNDGQLGFVALGGGQVAMLDIPGRSLIATISVGGTPHLIITGPYPPPDVPSPQKTTVSSLNLTLVVIIVILVLASAASWLVWRNKKHGYK